MSKYKSSNKHFNLLSNLAEIAHSKGGINLSNDHSDFPCLPELIDSLTRHMIEGRNKYAPGEGVIELREVVATHYKDCYGYAYNPIDEITITAGAIQGIYTAISSIIGEGDEVIVFEPAFETYVPAIEARGARPIFFQFDQNDYSIDWVAFTKLITSKTKLIIINSPHNPTGMVMSDESINQLQRILNGTKIFILSDEAFADLVYDNRPSFSITKYPKLAEKTIVVGSLGKALCVPGWKIGFVMSPAHLMERFREVHRYQIYSVNLPIQLALADYLRDKKGWSPYLEDFQRRRNLFHELMGETRFMLHHVEGGYFQVLSYQNISQESDFDFCLRLAHDHGVTAFPLSFFYHDGVDNQKLRICFGKSESDLYEAAKRLKRL